MKKFLFPALALSCLLAVAPCLSSQPVAAAEAPVKVLNTKSDWSIFTENKSKFEIKDGVVEIIPTTTDTGATYISHSYKNAVIEFDYQVSYDPDVDPYNEEDDLMPFSFFGVIFGNNVTVGPNWKGIQILPWSDGGKGGYPYMLAFDTERQTTDKESLRYTQVGLSLRRYRVTGSHSYGALWSTVDPADGEYLCSDTQMGTSLMPTFYKPVKVSDCFDTQKHKVKIDYRAEYVSMGADKDAMVINVWFDDDLVLTVHDEMPFKGESWGTEIDVDKRDKDGYIGIFAHHGSVDTADLYDWKVDISNMTITDLGVVNQNASNDKGNSGCSGNAMGAFAVCAALPVVVTVIVIKKKRGNV